MYIIILTNRGNYSFEKYLEITLCVMTLHCDVIVLQYHMQIDQSPRLHILFFVGVSGESWNDAS